jgi:hypothetical protein
VKFFRWLQEAFAQENNIVGPYSYFAGLGFSQLAGGPDYVTQLEKFGQVPLPAKQIFAQTDLDDITAVSQGDENQLADVPQQYDSSGAFGLLVLVVIFESAFNRIGGFGAFVSASVRIYAKLSDARQLILSLLFEFIYIFCICQINSPLEI